MKADIIVTGVVTGVMVGITMDVMEALKQKVLSGLEEEVEVSTEGPLVSAVVPALQEEDYLPLLLSSLRNQTYSPIEVLVADSSPPDSRDRTREVCRAFDARLVEADGLNISAARNAGAREARGEILLFSDADNILAPDCVEHLVRAICTGYLAASPVECAVDHDPTNFAYVWSLNWFKGRRTTRCVAVRADAFWKVGGYREDMDFFLRGEREDLQLGRDLEERFGRDALTLARDAAVGTSARRVKAEGVGPWLHRGVRNGVVA